MRRRRTWPVHLALGAVSAVMLVPFYWVVKTSVTGENIFAYPPSVIPRHPHLFYFVDVWYYIPFVRFLWNSVVVSAIVVGANVAFNALAGYALTQRFRGKRAVILALLSCMMIPFQATIVPAYLITRELGLLNSRLGLALPLLARIMVPLSTSAVATNVILSFIWSWNNFLWPLVIVRNEEMQTLPLGLSTFLSYLENTTGALYAFCILVLAPGILLFLLEQKRFIQGLTAGSTKG